MCDRNQYKVSLKKVSYKKKTIEKEIKEIKLAEKIYLAAKIIAVSAFHHLHQTVSQFVTLSCRKTTTCNKTKHKPRNASGSHGEFQAVHGHIPTQLFLAFLVRPGEGEYAPQSALTPPSKKSM